MISASHTQFNLHQRITQLYFRLILPLLALAIFLSGVQTNRVTLLAVSVLGTGVLVSTALHWLLPSRMELVAQSFFVVLVMLFVLVIALFSGPLGIQGDPKQVTIVLLFIPVNVLAWSMLSFKHPQLEQLIAVSLAVGGVLVLLRWNNLGVYHSGNAPLLLLLVCLSMLYFGNAVNKLALRLKEGEHELRRDALTGLMNRRAFNEQLQQHRPGGLVAVLDIDHFKIVNDTYGHSAGDRVLRAVADVLLDTFNDSAEVYRWGGEEFVVIFPAVPSLTAMQLLNAACQEIRNRTFVGGEHVTVSVGLSRITAEKSAAYAFEEADQALRQAKQNGRNRIQVALDVA